VLVEAVIVADAEGVVLVEAVDGVGLDHYHLHPQSALGALLPPAVQCQ
jgi:hypothetical protein